MSHKADAKKERFDRDEALRLVREASELYVAKGKRVVHVDLKKSPPSDDELAALILGPSGTLRAPALLATLAASSEGTVVWLEAGTVASGGTLGADDTPVLAVVHGDLRLAADLDVHGLLVVLGDWLGGTGELSLVGALVVTGEVSGAPAARLRYAPAILERLQATGPYVRVAGSWMDF